MNTEFQRSEQELSQKITIDNHMNVREELEVEATIEEWMNFIEEKNVNGVLSMYAEDSRSFDLMAPMENESIYEIRPRLEAWFGSFEGDLKVDIEHLRIFAERDTAFAHCMIRYQGTKTNQMDTDGEDMYNRVTFGFEKIDHDWLIVHMHSSLPFDMNSGKVMLDLKP